MVGGFTQGGCRPKPFWNSCLLSLEPIRDCCESHVLAFEKSPSVFSKYMGGGGLKKHGKVPYGPIVKQKRGIRAVQLPKIYQEA